MDQIEILHEGILLIAKPFCVKPNDASAIMIEPHDLTGIAVYTSRMPSFATDASTHYANDGLLTERGYNELGEQMISLYKAHKVLEKRINEIRESVSALHKSMEPCFRSENVISKNNFSMHKRELKINLRNGLLDKKCYDKQLVILKKKLLNWHLINTNIENNTVMILRYMTSQNIHSYTLLELISSYGIWASEDCNKILDHDPPPNYDEYY